MDCSWTEANEIMNGILKNYYFLNIYKTYKIVVHNNLND